jgi:hypothetical protein
MTVVIDGTNGVSGVDGTASNPSYEGTDSNTGIFFPAADTVAIGTGGTERLRVDSSGNVGVGTSSPAYKVAVQQDGNFNATINVSNATAGGSSTARFLAISDAGNASFGMTSSTYTDITGAQDAMLFNANSASGGIAWALDGTLRMKMDSSGNVGIGTSSPSVSGLDISRATGSASPTPAELRLTTTTNDSGWSTTNPWGRISFYSADASVGGAKVHASIQTTAQSSAGGNSNLDFFVTDTANGTLFRTLSFQGAGTNTTQTVFYSGGGTPAMTLDASGNFLVGTTTVAGSNLFTASAPASGTGGIAVRTNSTNNPSFELYNSSNARKSLIYLDVANVRTYVVTNDVNGVYLGSNATSWTTASDERIKDIIEPIENAVQKLESWRTVIGKYKSDEEGKRRSFLIAQDVLATFPEAVDTDNQDEYGLSYQDIIPVLVKSIQELKAELDATKAKVAALEGAA